MNKIKILLTEDETSIDIEVADSSVLNSVQNLVSACIGVQGPKYINDELILQEHKQSKEIDSDDLDRASGKGYTDILEIRGLINKLENGEQIIAKDFCCPSCFQSLCMQYDTDGEDSVVIKNPFDGKLYIAKKECCDIKKEELVNTLINNPDSILIAEIDEGIAISKEINCKCFLCGSENNLYNWYSTYLYSCDPYETRCPICNGNVQVETDKETNNTKMKCIDCNFIYGVGYIDEDKKDE